MGTLFSTSIGKKIIVSLSGAFLMIFMLVHLGLNLTLILDNTGELFNISAHFMATNPLIKAIEPVLAIGFIVHISFTLLLTIKNYVKRPIRYLQTNNSKTSSWASRNMFILGCLIIIFIALHLWQFFLKIKFTGDPLYVDITINGEQMKNSYLLVSTVFKTSWGYCIIYMIAAIILGLHLSHGFWSAFQTLGMNNKIWTKRLKTVSLIYATIIGVGFLIIPLYFLILS